MCLGGGGGGGGGGGAADKEGVFLMIYSQLSIISCYE